MVNAQEFLQLSISRRRLSRCHDFSRSLSGLYDPDEDMYYVTSSTELTTPGTLGLGKVRPEAP